MAGRPVRQTVHSVRHGAVGQTATAIDVQEIGTALDGLIKVVIAIIVYVAPRDAVCVDGSDATCPSWSC